MYKNSLTLHSVEKITSANTHFVPSLVIFSIRWYPDATSSKWHTNFAEVNLDEMTGSALWFWLIVAPMGVFICHTVSYAMQVRDCLRADYDFFCAFQFFALFWFVCVFVYLIVCLFVWFFICKSKLKKVQGVQMLISGFSH